MNINKLVLGVTLGSVCFWSCMNSDSDCPVDELNYQNIEVTINGKDSIPKDDTLFLTNLSNDYYDEYMVGKHRFSSNGEPGDQILLEYKRDEVIVLKDTVEILPHGDCGLNTTLEHDLEVPEVE